MNDRNAPVARARALGTTLLVAAIVGVNSICTQFVAGRLHHHPALGEPMFGSLYQPFKWWAWSFAFYEGAPHTYNYAFIMFALGVLIAMVGYVLYVGFATRSSRRHDGVHGTAHFASLEEVRKTGLLPPVKKRLFRAPEEQPGQGVYCGGFDDPETGQLRYLRHDGPEHVCALAPTRSGKGVGLVIPTLLSWPHSTFVLDIKGENYALTAGWRRKHANNVILRFEPAEPGVGCSWNPLAEIRFGTRYQVSDAQNIALMVIDDDGKGIAGDHFRSAAYELLVGLILHGLYKSASVGRIPGLYDCAHMLTGVGDFAATEQKDGGDDSDGDPRALTSLFHEMQAVELGSEDAAEKEAQLVIAGVGRRMANTPARELGSIISTANNALSLYRDPIVGENTSRVDFKVADLMDHDKPVSLYFITTPDNQLRMKPLARLLTAMILMRLTGRMEFDESGRSRTAHKHRLLMLLDEFTSLGKLEIFQKALAFVAGYGIKVYIIIQDIMQLYFEYTQHEAIISNCHIRIAYAPNKPETAEWLSKMTGVMTVVKEQITTSGKRFGAVLEQVSRTYQEVQRPLMTPDEIMRLPQPVKDESGEKILEAGELLAFAAGHPPIRGRQILYFMDPTFSERARIAPPAQSDRVRQSPIATAVAVDSRAPVEATPSKGFVIQ